MHLRANLCVCKHTGVWVRVCLCMCAGRPEHHCAAATTGPPSPPARHNKEQLNAAALPAEEPTASHTSTNRQICLKPKGRSNKSQPTESNPLQSLSTDSNQKVTGWLASPCTITVQAALQSDVQFYMQNLTQAVMFYTWYVHMNYRSQGVKLHHAQRLCSLTSAEYEYLHGFRQYPGWAVRCERSKVRCIVSFQVSVCFFQWRTLPPWGAYTELHCLFDVPNILLSIKAFCAPHLNSEKWEHAAQLISFLQLLAGTHQQLYILSALCSSPMSPTCYLCQGRYVLGCKVAMKHDGLSERGPKNNSFHFEVDPNLGADSWIFFFHDIMKLEALKWLNIYSSHHHVTLVLICTDVFPHMLPAQSISLGFRVRCLW